MEFLSLDVLNPYIVLILVTGIFLTFRLGFPQFRFLFLGLKILTGNMDAKGSKGQIVHSQAFYTGTASTLVMGSFIGTCLAISVAGIGVLFWIWVCGFCIMPIRLVSSTLAIRFRNKLPNGRFLSGPMYFIEKALKAKWLSFAFVIGILLTVLSLGSMIPSLAITYVTEKGLGLKGVAGVFGVSVIVVFIVLGGIRRIGRAGSVLAPIGLAFFFVGSILLFSDKFQNFFGFLKSVFEAAFANSNETSREKALLTVAGVALFYLSTETGIGKSSGVSGVVRTDYPAKHGLASMLSTFFEAYVFASFNGFLLYSLGAINFETQMGLFSTITDLGGIGGILFYVSFLSFGILSLSGWFYVGEQGAYYFLGEKFTNFFRLLYITIFVGTSFYITKFGNAYLFDMIKYSFYCAVLTSVPLLVSLVLLSKIAKAELLKYVQETGVRYEVFKDFYLLLLTILPKNILSKLFGYFSMFKLPRFMMIPILKAFAKAYKINLNEAALEIEEYASLNQFFTRALRAGSRIIDSAPNAVVSPVDAKITAFGDIKANSLIQAKGIDYNLKELLGSEKYLDRFNEGKFMTFYLSPQDYHRIHSPFEGRIMGYYYEPGKLFPVNDLAVLNIQSLFPKNERLITFLETEYGMVAVIKVGANNVGKIRVTYDQKIVTNTWLRFAKEVEYKDVSIMINKGGELGRFEMGSTVVLVFEKNSIELSKFQLGEKIQYGSVIGFFSKKKGSSK